MKKREVLEFAVGLCVAFGVASAAEDGGQQTPSVLIESLAGRDNFERYCASCHGVDARGEGPVAPALRVAPADLTALARKNGGTFPRERVLAFISGTGPAVVSAHGSADMPVWGPIFKALDPSDVRVRLRLDNVVRHVESLQAPSTAANDPGNQLFRTHCATCHGPDGRGNGPMADQLVRKPPDLTQYTARNGGVFPSERLRSIIDGRGVPAHGGLEMPVWGNVFKRDAGSTEESVKARIDAIVRYLAGIQARGARLDGGDQEGRLANRRF